MRFFSLCKCCCKELSLLNVGSSLILWNLVLSGNDVFPKFVRWRNINNQSLKKKSRYYRRILLDEIDEKIKHLKNLKLQLVKEHTLLNGITTWVKRSDLMYTSKMVRSKEERKWIKTHNKKLDGLISHKKEISGINQNPNSIITNLSSRTINNEEYKILTSGLNHGIGVSAKQNDILAHSEALWDQLK